MKNHHCLLLPIAVILLVGGTIALLVFGLGNIEPYSHTKDYPEATCTVVHSNSSGYQNCRHHLTESDDVMHPCVVIRVNYTSPEHNHMDAFLYESYETWLEQQTHNISCSIHVCDSEYYDRDLVEQFMTSYGQLGQSYKCFYNPKNQDEVYLHTVTSSHVLHYILWPCLALGFGMFMLVVVIFSSCEVWVCNRKRKWKNRARGHSYDLTNRYPSDSSRSSRSSRSSSSKKTIV